MNSYTSKKEHAFDDVMLRVMVTWDQIRDQMCGLLIHARHIRGSTTRPYTWALKAPFLFWFNFCSSLINSKHFKIDKASMCSSGISSLRVKMCYCSINETLQCYLWIWILDYFRNSTLSFLLCSYNHDLFFKCKQQLNQHSTPQWRKMPPKRGGCVEQEQKWLQKKKGTSKNYHSSENNVNEHQETQG